MLDLLSRSLFRVLGNQEGNRRKEGGGGREEEREREKKKTLPIKENLNSASKSSQSEEIIKARNGITRVLVNISDIKPSFDTGKTLFAK